MRRTFSFHGDVIAGLMLGLAGLAGCGVLTYRRTEFEDQMVGDEGQDIILDDLNDILNDDTLDDAGKRQALRDLGIEDEDLLDAILAGA